MISRTDAEKALENCASDIRAATDDYELRLACRNMLSCCLDLLHDMTGTDDMESLFDKDVLFPGLDRYGGPEAVSAFCGRMSNATVNRYLLTDTEDAFRTLTGLMYDYMASAMRAETDGIVSGGLCDSGDADALIDRCTDLCEEALDYRTPDPAGTGLVLNTVECFARIYEHATADAVRDHCMFSTLVLIVLAEKLSDGSAVDTEGLGRIGAEAEAAYTERGHSMDDVSDEVDEILAYRRA